MSDLTALCFWPGGEAANPDALHPGKAREQSPGKSSLFPGIFPGFLGPEALKLSVTPARQAEAVDIPNNVISPVAGPGSSGPWLGSGANSPSVTPKCIKVPYNSFLKPIYILAFSFQIVQVISRVKGCAKGIP